MALINLTKETFEPTVLADGIVFADFWAGWCGPCMTFAPVFESAAVNNPDILFGKVDTEAEQELSQEVAIMSIPTLMAFRDGILLYREAGALSQSAFDALINQIRNLDMERVRAEISQSTEPPTAQ